MVRQEQLVSPVLMVFQELSDQQASKVSRGIVEIRAFKEIQVKLVLRVRPDLMELQDQ